MYFLLDHTLGYLKLRKILVLIVRGKMLISIYELPTSAVAESTEKL